MKRALVLMASSALLGCAGETAGSAESGACVSLAFSPELPSNAAEAYTCFAFQANADMSPIQRVSWHFAPDSGIALHHATLYTTAESRPLGRAFACDPMPIDVQSVHVWVPGSESLVLPEDTAVALRRDTRTLIVEAHSFRASGQGAAPVAVSLCKPARAPLRLAGRFALGAPVPAIRPHTREVSSARCRVGSKLHLLYSWPHMHRVGRAFQAALWRGTMRIPMLEVNDWDFTHQQTYAIDVEALPGDSIETRCVWQNDTDAYVLPGIFSDNEMCSHGLTAVPAQSAFCDPE